MEECKNKNNHDNRKRVRDDDSVADTPESKIPRVDSSESDSVESELVRVDSVGDSSGVGEIHDDLLNILEDTTENVAERDPTMQGLDSVIKSFEDEILSSGQDPNQVPESAEFNPNLGYLLEASDDELGLPPTVAPTEEKKPEVDEPGRVGPEGIDLTGFLGFEDEFRGYDAFAFGNGGLVDYDAVDNGGGYVMIDGLFDHSEPSDILWRSESLQAM